jgi:N-acetyl-alpha-D-muramate 1-phosphate uridylyltransferase
VSLPVAILAGGLATRLRPITEKVPKALIEVAGQPFLCRQLKFLQDQKVRRVVLCIGYLGEQIEALIGSGAKFELDVHYVPDGPSLLGTGGALRKALPLLGDQFMVLYGDSFLPVDFVPIEQTFLASGKLALMTVLRNSNRWDKSNVLFQDGRLVEYNKQATRPEMKYIDYGLGIISSRTLIGYPENQSFDLAEVYHRLSLEGQLMGYEVHERFYEIGSPSGVRETEEYFLSKEKA